GRKAAGNPASAILAEPVRVGKALADAAPRVAQLFLFVRERDAHRFLRGLCGASAARSGGPIAPAAASRLMAAGRRPISRSTSTVFSPRPGGWRAIAGRERLQRLGKPATRKRPPAGRAVAGEKATAPRRRA